MKKILLTLFTLLLICSTVSWGQISYNTVDNFDRSDSETLGACSSGNSTWTEYEPTGDADQLSISGNVLWTVTSDTTMYEPTSASINLTNENASFDFGSAATGWSFHFDLNYNPSGWTNSYTSLGWVLVANETDFSSTTIDGYAVVWNGTNDQLVLTLFNNGISGSTNVGTAIIETGVDWDSISTNGMNIRVELATDGIWTMYWEDGTPIGTPTDIDANSLSSSNTTTLFDDTNMLFSGPIWSHGTSSQTGSFDNFTFGIETLSSVDNPSVFNAGPASTSQIDLHWSLNSNNNDVLIAYTAYEAVAGNPVDGVTYSATDALPGGGTVIYVGSLTSFNHTSLDASSYYHYKAWSVDGSTNYSSGVTDNAATLTPEPTNHIANLSVGTISSSSITLNWDTIAGGIEADGYYLFINDTLADLPSPVDGTEISGDADFSDGDGAVVVTNDVNTYTWTGLSAETTYYFAIYSYTNADTLIDYKTDGTIPQISAETSEAVTATIYISEVTDPVDIYQTRYVELYNSSPSAIDLSTHIYYLCRQTNGNPTSWEDKQLTGSINAGKTYVLAQSNDDASDYFYQSFGFLADYNYGGSSGNGDDGYFLYSGGDHNTGVLIDAYGVIDEDGTGKIWEYEDSKAVRKTTVTSPSAIWIASEWNIVAAGTARMSPGSYPASVWNGSISNDWTDASNWDNDLVSSTINAIIWDGATNFPTITAAANVKNLTLESDATLLGAKNLSIADSATIKRSLNVGTWQYLTPPTTNATANDIEITTSGQYAYLLQYNNDVAGSGVNDTTLSLGWEYLTHDTDALTAGKGYGVWVTENKEINFTGTLATGDQTITGITTGDSGSNHWVFIGNSALAHIDWTAILNDDDVTGGVAYLYDPDFTSTNNYGSINTDGTELNQVGSEFIPPMQGFFIHASGSGDGSFTIPTTSLTHSTQSFYKSAKVLHNFIKLSVSIGDYSDECAVYFKEEAENGFDSNCDGLKFMMANPEYPLIYSLADNNKLAYNILKEWPIAVPINIHSSKVEKLTLNASEINNLEQGVKVYLEDKLTSTVQNLSLMPEYSFDATIGENDNRFVLYFTDSALAVTQQFNSTKIYSYRSTIVIERTSPKIAKMEVYSLNGQLVYGSMINSNISKIETQLTKGIYLVKLLEDQGQSIQKVNLNN